MFLSLLLRALGPRRRRCGRCRRRCRHRRGGRLGPVAEEDVRPRAAQERRAAQVSAQVPETGRPGHDGGAVLAAAVLGPGEGVVVPVLVVVVPHQGRLAPRAQAVDLPVDVVGLGVELDDLRKSGVSNFIKGNENKAEESNPYLCG